MRTFTMSLLVGGGLLAYCVDRRGPGRPEVGPNPVDSNRPSS